MPATIALVAAGLAGLIMSALILTWPTARLDAPRLDTRGDSVGFGAVLNRAGDPVKETELFLTLSIIIVVVAAAGVGLLLAMIRSHRGLASYDVRLSTYAAQHATDRSTFVLKRINTFGGTGTAIVGSMVVAAIESRRRRAPSILGFLLLVVAGQFALANTIKFIVGRARPAIDPLSGFSSSSFPSGHATAASAGFAAFAMLLGSGRSRTVRAGLSGAAVAIAVAVALTRVFLGVHWLTDVIGGLLIGWGWFTLSSIAFGGRRLRLADPSKQAASVTKHE